MSTNSYSYPCFTNPIKDHQNWMEMTTNKINANCEKSQKENDKMLKDFQNKMAYNSQSYMPKFPSYHTPFNVTNDSSSVSDSSDFTTTSEEILKNAAKKEPIIKNPIKKPLNKKADIKPVIKKETTIKKNKKNDTNQNIIINNYVANTSPEEKVVNIIKPVSYTLEELKKYKVDGLKELCAKNNIVMKKRAIRTDYETALIKL